jgi:hypothetical protein
MWRNNGDGTFTDVTDSLGLSGDGEAVNTRAAIGTDFNNDRAVDLIVTGGSQLSIFENPREGKFRDRDDLTSEMSGGQNAVAVLDFDHDGWMDLAFTYLGGPTISLQRNLQGKGFDAVGLGGDWRETFGIAAIDYDNDGWVDLVAVGETKDGKGEVRLFRNLGANGFKDVTADVGLDKIQIK